MNKILLSIITINYNNVKGLKETIESVKKQTYKPLEYIIIDGGSNDGSLEIIRENESYFKYWISEKDNGIYHAMNKGVEMANGEYLLFLNSGDYLYSKYSLEQLIESNNNEDILYGDLIMQSGQNTWLKKHPDTLNFEFFLNNSLPHPASLIKKTLFYKTGFFSEHFKIVSDWEFFMNAVCKDNVSYRHVEVPITVFIQDGISSKGENFNLLQNEKEKVLLNFYSAFLNDYKMLDKYRSEANHFTDSRIHKTAEIFLKSVFYKNIKKFFKR